MDAEPIKKQLHRYYDMIAGGVCLVRQSAEEQILFVNKEMLKLYQCKTEQEFYQLTKGRFAGLMEADDYLPLEARMNSRHGDAKEGMRSSLSAATRRRASTSTSRGRSRTARCQALAGSGC